MRKYVLIGVICIALIVGATFWYISSQNKKSIDTVSTDFDSGNLDAAIQKAEEVVAVNQNDTEALLALAATYAQKGSVTFKEEENAKKAIEYADRVIAIDSRNSEAYRIKGYAYEIQELYTEAHVNYDQAIALDAKNSQAFSNKGHAFDLQGDLAKAEEYYQLAIDISPANDHALINLARLQIRKNKFEDARITIDGLISTTQNNHFKAEGYQLLSYMAYNEEDFAAALEAIDKSIALDPNIPQSLVSRAKISMGTVLSMETQEDINALIAEARVDLDRALAINPNQASAYLLLSEIEIITGNKTAQLEMKKRALEAVELDITLGAAEKAALKSYLQAQIKINNN